MEYIVMEEDFYSAYNRNDPTVFEDYGPSEIPTGLLDRLGNPILKSNPKIKPPIGFHRPSSLGR